MRAPCTGENEEKQGGRERRRRRCWDRYISAASGFFIRNICIKDYRLQVQRFLNKYFDFLDINGPKGLGIPSPLPPKCYLQLNSNCYFLLGIPRSFPATCRRRGTMTRCQTTCSSSSTRTQTRWRWDHVYVISSHSLHQSFNSAPKVGSVVAAASRAHPVSHPTVWNETTMTGCLAALIQDAYLRVADGGSNNKRS